MPFNVKLVGIINTQPSDVSREKVVMRFTVDRRGGGPWRLKEQCAMLSAQTYAPMAI